MERQNVMLTWLLAGGFAAAARPQRTTSPIQGRIIPTRSVQQESAPGGEDWGLATGPFASRDLVWSKSTGRAERVVGPTCEASVASDCLRPARSWHRSPYVCVCSGHSQNGLPIWALYLWGNEHWTYKLSTSWENQNSLPTYSISPNPTTSSNWWNVTLFY